MNEAAACGVVFFFAEGAPAAPAASAGKYGHAIHQEISESVSESASQSVSQ